MPALAAATPDDENCADRAIGCVHAYRPRAAEHTILHRIVRAHLATFLRAAESAGGVPPFVEREFRQFLTCGVSARGFARFRWTCHAERRVSVMASSASHHAAPACSSRRNLRERRRTYVGTSAPVRMDRRS